MKNYLSKTLKSNSIWLPRWPPLLGALPYHNNEYPCLTSLRVRPITSRVTLGKSYKSTNASSAKCPHSSEAKCRTSDPKVAGSNPVLGLKAMQITKPKLAITAKVRGGEEKYAYPWIAHDIL